VKLRMIVLGVIIGTFLAGGTALGVAKASGTNSSTIYYACLVKGKLAKVGTTSPTCPKNGTVISWGSTGPQGPAGLANTTEYLWTGTLPSSPSGTSKIIASTVIPSGSVLTLVSASISGNFSACDQSSVDAFFDVQTPTVIARWGGTNTDFVAAPPDLTESPVTMPGSVPLGINDECFGPSSLIAVPALNFTITFDVTPTPTAYS
jgi:hypothetical protein